MGGIIAGNGGIRLHILDAGARERRTPRPPLRLSTAPAPAFEAVRVSGKRACIALRATPDGGVRGSINAAQFLVQRCKSLRTGLAECFFGDPYWQVRLTESCIYDRFRRIHLRVRLGPRRAICIASASSLYRIFDWKSRTIWARERGSVNLVRRAWFGEPHFGELHSTLWLGRSFHSAIYDWSEGAPPGDRPGPNPTRKAAAEPVAPGWM